MSFKIVGIVMVIGVILVTLAVLDLFDTVMGAYWRVAESIHIPTSVIPLSPYTVMTLILSVIASALVISGVIIIARSIREKVR